MSKFPAIQTVEDLEAFEQSFSVSFDANELRAAIFHISDAYRTRAEADAQLLEALRYIAVSTDPDNPDSYRNDDREGCLDMIQSLSRSALIEAGDDH